MLWKRQDLSDEEEYVKRIENIKSNIGSRLKRLRREKSKTIADVSKDIGISCRTLGNYERKTRIPGIEVLLLLSAYYDVSVDYLLGRNNNEENYSK